MTSGLRVGLAKPDFGVRGGFENVVDRVVAGLVAAGHTVEPLTVARDGVGPRVRGLDVEATRWARNREFLTYAAMLERFEGLDASRFDLVLSTQPPSFAVSHPRHLSLFYHHQRVYYDLAEVYVAAGFTDPELHRHATAAVRAMDRPHLEAVTGFLTGSRVVADRLVRFQGIEALGTFDAGVEAPAEVPPLPATPAALCISRQEFPKRTELFVAAMHLLDGVAGHLVGDGGRLAWVRELDRRMAAGEVDPAALSPTELWCNTGVAPPSPAAEVRSPVTMWGRVDDRRLADLIAASTVVVAPALDEDFGLTAIEGMLAGRPVVVCRDGGGLTELVRDGVDGLVVDPTPSAVADAVRELCADPDRAREMGAAGREAGLAFTWERATEQVHRAIEQVTA